MRGKTSTLEAPKRSSLKLKLGPNKLGRLRALPHGRVLLGTPARHSDYSTEHLGSIRLNIINLTKHSPQDELIWWDLIKGMTLHAVNSLFVIINL